LADIVMQDLEEKAISNLDRFFILLLVTLISYYWHLRLKLIQF